MSDNSSVQYGGGGIGCLTALGIVFVALKLAEVGKVAEWSWWWVLAPFWIQPAIAIGIFLVILIIAVIAALLDR